MKKRTNLTILPVFAILFTFVSTANANLPGSGTEADPYLIQSLVDFDEFAGDPNYWDDNIRLETDVNLAGKTYTTTAVIAPDTNNSNWDFDGTPFSGAFDGNDHVISNLELSAPDSYNIGLFGFIDSGGSVKNLGIEDANLVGAFYESGTLVGFNKGFIHNCYGKGSVKGSGGLVGYNYAGTVSGCYFTGSVEGIGGLAGNNDYGNIFNCHFSGDVKGSGGLVGNNVGGIILNCYVEGNIISNWEEVGGLVGNNNWGWIGDDAWIGTIANCYAIGSVQGNASCVGGLVGKNSCAIGASYAENSVVGDEKVGGLVGENVWEIGNCYATGLVDGNDMVGGLVGFDAYGWSDIHNCYSTGVVTGDSNVGGLIGLDERGLIDSNCFWDVDTSGLTISDGGLGKTTLQMKDPNTFIEAGWNFERPVWMICGQDYPKLVWNYPNINGDERIDFADYSEITSFWLASDCGICGGTDLTGDRNVDMNDLMVLVESWIEEDKISDHVFAVGISMGWDYDDADDPDDTKYDFEFEVRTDHKVEKIEFLAPSGSSFEIPKTVLQLYEVTDGEVETYWEYDGDEFEWFYDAEFTNSNSLSTYDDGEYTITVYYDNGRQEQTTVWFGIPDTSDFLPQPTQEPTLVSPTYGESVSSPVTMSWLPCTDPNAGYIWLDLEHESYEQELEYDFPVSVTGLGDPIELSTGIWWAILGFEISYETQDSNGINIEVEKYSESDYEFTVEP